MIQELYIKRAIKIRKEYLKLVNEISSYEQIAKDLITAISDRKSDLENLLKELQSNKISNPNTAQNKLSEIMIKTEDDMNKIDTTINSLNLKMDKLREDEVYLYKEIKNTHFDLSDEEIKKYIQEKLKKENLS